MIKKISSLITVTIVVFALAACSSGSGESAKYKAKEVTDKVRAAMTDLGELKETDMSSDTWTNIMAYVTDIPKDKVKDLDYLYMTDGSAEEICVIILSDEDSAKKVESDMKNRINVRKSHFETYDPAEISKVEAACALRSGNTCILIIGNQAQNGKFEFNKMMSE